MWYILHQMLSMSLDAWYLYKRKFRPVIVNLYQLTVYWLITMNKAEVLQHQIKMNVVVFLWWSVHVNLQHSVPLIKMVESKNFLAYHLKMSVWRCQCQDINLKMSVLRCQSQDVILKMSIWRCQCKDVNLKVSVSRCHSRDVSLNMSISRCQYQDINLKTSSIVILHVYIQYWVF